MDKTFCMANSRGRWGSKSRGLGQQLLRKILDIMMVWITNVAKSSGETCSFVQVYFQIEIDKRQNKIFEKDDLDPLRHPGYFRESRSFRFKTLIFNVFFDDFDRFFFLWAFRILIFISPKRLFFKPENRRFLLSLNPQKLCSKLLSLSQFLKEKPVHGSNKPVHAKLEIFIARMWRLC